VTSRVVLPLLPPEVLEPGWGQIGVAHRVLDVPVTQVSLERPRVVSSVGQSIFVTRSRGLTGAGAKNES
jgi:hypothetical protein